MDDELDDLGSLKSAGEARCRCLQIFGRLYLLIGTLLAITSSIFVILSCQFFVYRALDNIPWEGLDPPFDTLPSASIGLFRYSEITTLEGNVLLGNECQLYEDWKEAGTNKIFYIAQIASFAPPGLAFLAWIQVVTELCCCRLRGSKLVLSLLFLFAFILQMCTFLVFADTDFCFEEDSLNVCTLMPGAWYSVGSSIAYFIAGLTSALLPVFPGSVCCGGCCISTIITENDDFRRNEYTNKDAEGSTSSSNEERNNWLDLSENQPSAKSEETPEEQNEPNNDNKFNELMAIDPSGSVDDMNDSKMSDSKMSESRMSDTITNNSEDDIELKPQRMFRKLSDPTVQTGTTASAQTKELDTYTEEANVTYEIAETSIHNRTENPDLLDQWCCGDPLELEKYMGGQSNNNALTQLRKIPAERSTSNNVVAAHSEGQDNELTTAASC